MRLLMPAGLVVCADLAIEQGRANRPIHIDTLRREKQSTEGRNTLRGEPGWYQ